MSSQRNSSGMTLSDPAWLETHHRAKLVERTEFARRIAALKPQSIVDLGCGTGLWLGLLDKMTPRSCVFTGVDVDETALQSARARKWNHEAHFVNAPIESYVAGLSHVDVCFLFNMFPFIAEGAALIDHLSSPEVSRRIAVRQYDGALLRFGPLDVDLRARLEESVFASLAGDPDFRHYDLDRAFTILRSSRLTPEFLEFEVTTRIRPFDPHFEQYARGTLDWVKAHVSQDLKDRLNAAFIDGLPDYFVGADLVALLRTDSRA